MNWEKGVIVWEGIEMAKEVSATAPCGEFVRRT